MSFVLIFKRLNEKWRMPRIARIRHFEISVDMVFALECVDPGLALRERAPGAAAGPPLPPRLEARVNDIRCAR